MNKNIKVGIVGAGIQGISNALFLQKKGFNVTIFDRDNPGAQAASYGNAGHFSPYASVPLNRPDVLADVPAMLMSSSGPLALKWNYVPKMIPWFLKFIMNSTTKNMMHTAKNMHQILDLALPAYDELFDEIELEGLVENKGILYIWNDQDLKSREFERVDIRVGTILSAEEFKEAIKPAIKMTIDFGSEIGIKKSSAQITDHYNPESLIGMQIAAVINFPKKQIGPIMSECLGTGFTQPDGSIILAIPQKGATNGSRLA